MDEVGGEIRIDHIGADDGACLDSEAFGNMAVFADHRKLGIGGAENCTDAGVGADDHLLIDNGMFKHCPAFESRCW